MRAICVLVVLPLIMGSQAPSEHSAPSTTTSREFLLPAPENPRVPPHMMRTPESSAPIPRYEDDPDTCSVAEAIKEHLNEVGQTIEAYRERHGLDDATSEDLKQDWVLLRQLEQELEHQRADLEIAEAWLEGNDDPASKEWVEELRRRTEVLSRNADRLRDDLVALERAYRVERAMMWARDMVKIYLQSRDWNC